MKKALFLLSLILAVPSVCFGAIAAGWNTPSLGNGYITPTPINGIPQGILISGPATVIGTTTLATTTATVLNGVISVDGVRFAQTGLGIQAAINACNAVNVAGGYCGAVFIPAGNYITTAGISIPSNITVYGVGYGSYVHNTNTSALSGNVFQNADQINGNSNIQIHDLRLDGGGDLKSVGGNPRDISFVGVDNFIIQNNTVSNSFITGVYLQTINGTNGSTSNNGIVQNNTFDHIGEDAITAVGIGRVQILNNRCYGHNFFPVLNNGMQRCVDIEGHVNDSIVISGNILDGFKAQGIQVDNPSSGSDPIGSKNIIITGNIVKNLDDTYNTSSDNSWGIGITDRGQSSTTNAVIANNVIFNLVSANIPNAVYGIHVSSLYPVLVSDNSVMDVYGNTTGSCIEIEKGSNNIEGNNVNSCYYGINITGGAGNFLNGNIATNTTQNLLDSGTLTTAITASTTPGYLQTQGDIILNGSGGNSALRNYKGATLFYNHVGVSDTTLAYRFQVTSSETKAFDILNNTNGVFYGNLGIGSSSPSQKLSVSGNIEGTGNILTTSGEIGVGLPSGTNPLQPLYILAVSTNDHAQNQIIDVVDNSPMAQGVGGGITFGGQYKSDGTVVGSLSGITGIKENGTDSNYAGALTFETRINGGFPTERMRISSGGNLGIGTTSPSSILSVQGNVLISGTTTLSGLIATGTASTTALIISNSSACNTTSALTTNSVGNVVCGAISSASVGSGLSGQLGYYNVSGTNIIGTSTNPLYVDGIVATSSAVASSFSYRLGIGSTSPYALFAIMGAANGTTPLFVTATTTGTATATPFTIAANGTATFNVTDAGSAATGLTINDVGGTSPTNGQPAMLEINGTHSPGISLNNSGTRYTIENASSKLIFFDGSTQEMQLNANKLDVGGTSANNTIDVTGTMAIGLSFTGTAAPSNGLIVQGTTGIGTSSPYALLSVHAGASSTLSTLFAVASTTNVAGVFSSTTLFAISNTGWQVTSGPLPTASACGSTNVVNGNQTAGDVMLTGTLVTSCTITFAQPVPPGTTLNCLVGDNSTVSEPSITATTTSSITIGLSASVSTLDLLWQCGATRNANN